MTSLEKQNNRKSLSSLKIILPTADNIQLYSTRCFFSTEGKKVNRDVYYCFMAMKCGTNAKPPSNDPCAACLGPGFISIMCSIYSAVITRGYKKKPALFKNTGTSCKSCLKGRANSQMKLVWYVCTYKVENPHFLSQLLTGKPRLKQTAATLRESGILSTLNWELNWPNHHYITRSEKSLLVSPWNFNTQARNVSFFLPQTALVYDSLYIHHVFANSAFTS